jgi:hypothetical protein
MNPEVEARLRATFGRMGQLIVDIQSWLAADHRRRLGRPLRSKRGVHQP